MMDTPSGTVPASVREMISGVVAAVRDDDARIKAPARTAGQGRRHGRAPCAAQAAERSPAPARRLPAALTHRGRSGRIPSRRLAGVAQTPDRGVSWNHGLPADAASQSEGGAGVRHDQGRCPGRRARHLPGDVWPAISTCARPPPCGTYCANMGPSVGTRGWMSTADGVDVLRLHRAQRAAGRRQGRRKAAGRQSCGCAQFRTPWPGCCGSPVLAASSPSSPSRWARACSELRSCEGWQAA